MQMSNAPELMQEVQAQGDFVRHFSAAVFPLEDVAPVAANARQRIPQVPVVHVIHRQDRVALRSPQDTIKLHQTTVQPEISKLTSQKSTLRSDLYLIALVQALFYED